MDRMREIYPDATKICGQYEVLSGRAYMDYTIEFKDKKKKVTPLLCSHCPHCGQPYPMEGSI